MIFQLLSFLLLLLVPAMASAAEFDDESFCNVMMEQQKKINADAGQMVDAVTRNDGVAVLCSTKIIDFKKFMASDSSKMREGWQDRKAKQWNEIYCNGVFLDAINNGWTVAFTLIFQDGNRFWYKANCDSSN